MITQTDLLLKLLTQLEKEALAALGKVENSEALAAWHKRYIKGERDENANTRRTQREEAPQGAMGNADGRQEYQDAGPTRQPVPAPQE